MPNHKYGLQNQVSGDRLENVEHYFDNNIDKELEGEDEEKDVLGILKSLFKDHAQRDGLKGKASIRWNSTYLMLETAISLKIAFDAYEDVHLAYKTNLSRQLFDGIPTDYDWERAKVLVKSLRHFYNLTLRISGAFNDVELNEMTRKMKEKYDKYWGSIEKINITLYYAVIFNPRHKLEFIEFIFDKLYGGTKKINVMKDQVRDGLYELFNDYKLRYGHALQGTPGSPGSSFSCVSSSFSSSVGKSMQYTDYEATRTFTIEQEFSMYKTGEKGDRVKSELEKYLGVDVEMYKDKFDILNWWKVNTQSTGGRVLDVFRSYLSPKMVQALICTQDWIRKDSKRISIEENLSELEVVEKGIMVIGGVTQSWFFLFGQLKVCEHMLKFWDLSFEFVAI
ncbi:UNVERIFIED_CONTAM: putative AC transposase [Sesamum latifolium]|uniref:AC transposase n=1 Tax=Sesamum latifolium TaxID=2727402 RepID=A0AAW2WHA5_9LAMI